MAVISAATVLNILTEWIETTLGSMSARKLLACNVQRSNKFTAVIQYVNPAEVYGRSLGFGGGRGRGVREGRERGWERVRERERGEREREGGGGGEGGVGGIAREGGERGGEGGGEGERGIYA